MLISRLAAGLLGYSLLTGCFLPGDPEGVLIGIRVDDGVVSAYLPLCPGERVTGAEASDPRGDGRVLWTGKGPSDPKAKVVQINGTGWREQTGSFRSDGKAEFGIDVDTTQGAYGAGGLVKIATDLPPGTYEVSGGRRLTGPEIDALAPCDSRQGSDTSKPQGEDTR